MNYTYMSLITSNDFMPGIIVMLESFKNIKSKYPMHIIITPDISQENRKILQYYGAELIEENQLMPAGRTSEVAYLDTATRYNVHKCIAKLYIFKYEQFDKIIYVDADMVFLQNIDDLFDRAPHMSAVADRGFENVDVKPFTKNQFNAGFIVVVPNMDEYNELITIMNDQEQLGDVVGFTDQDVLFRKYIDWPERQDLHLPMYYNYMIWRHREYDYNSMFNQGKICIKHMMGLDKPWRTNNIDYFKLNGGIQFTADMVEYVNMINYCIYDLATHGLTSSNLNYINLTMSI